MSKRKILLVINSGLVNAGVPHVVKDIIEGLHNEYHFEIAVQSSDVAYFDDYFKSLGCIIHYLGPPKNGRKRIFYNLFLHPIKINRILKMTSFDVIHSFTGYQSGIDCAIGYVNKVPVRISNVHGTITDSNKRITGLYERMCKFLIRRFPTKRIGVSEQAAKSIYKGLSYEVIYNSVDFRAYENIEKVNHKGINILQIGYFCRNKNQLFSLDILNRLRKHNRDFHMYFIGYENSPTYLTQMNQYIRDNRLGSHVTFLNHDCDKFKIFPIIDFGLIPSIHEGLSLVALELQAAKIITLGSISIPSSVNIGYLHRLSLDNIDDWIKTLTDSHNSYCINKNTLCQFSRDTFLLKIKNSYQ